MPPKHILITPLDWGSGHTTRCIPIIRHLTDNGHNVTVAANSAQESLIKNNLHNIDIVRLEGYNVRYSQSGAGFMFSLLQQIPRLLSVIKYEHQWLLDFTAKHPVDGILSDNRYGIYHPEIPNVFMTHQLAVKTGMGKILDGAAQRLHKKYLKKFGEIFVPDAGGDLNLAGSLSHPSSPPPNTRYIGWLSQFQDHPTPVKNNHLLILLSGPEPQRTLLSNKLWNQVRSHAGKVIFIEGSPFCPKRANIPPHITYHQQLAAHQLQPLLANASMVICRSGYSTLMDLVRLNKKAILIPTPGQTEQLYLSKHLNEQGSFPSILQDDFELEHALSSAAGFPYKPLGESGSHALFKSIISQWIDSLPQKQKSPA